MRIGFRGRRKRKEHEYLFSYSFCPSKESEGLLVQVSGLTEQGREAAELATENRGVGRRRRRKTKEPKWGKMKVLKFH